MTDDIRMIKIGLLLIAIIIAGITYNSDIENTKEEMHSVITKMPGYSENAAEFDAMFEKAHPIAEKAASKGLRFEQEKYVLRVFSEMCAQAHWRSRRDLYMPLYSYHFALATHSDKLAKPGPIPQKFQTLGNRMTRN